jgi:hypothetical protein
MLYNSIASAGEQSSPLQRIIKPSSKESKMKLWDKLNSRKLWVAVTGIVTSAANGEPVLSAIIGGAYILIEGIIDAVRAGTSGMAK